MEEQEKCAQSAQTEYYDKRDELESTGESQSQHTDVAACLFVVCRDYIESLKEGAADLSLSAFKKLLIEKMTYNRSDCAPLVSRTRKSIAESRTMPMHFYVTGFSLGTSVFFEMLVDELNKQPGKFAPFLLKCGGTIEEHDDKWEWKPEDSNVRFEKINEELLRLERGGKSLLKDLSDISDKKYKDKKTVADEAYEIIKGWIYRKASLPPDCPNAQRIVLLDHIDRFFIEMFQLHVETMGKEKSQSKEEPQREEKSQSKEEPQREEKPQSKEEPQRQEKPKGYDLWQISLLRRVWIESIRKLNQDTIPPKGYSGTVFCAASVLTELEGFWKDLPIDTEDPFKRTRVRKQWSRVAANSNYFIEILEMMFETDKGGRCIHGATNYRLCPHSQLYTLRLELDGQRWRWHPDILKTVSKLKECTDGDPRLFFLFCYHAIKQRDNDSQMNCIRTNLDKKISTLDCSIKDYYKEGRNRASSHSTLLEDFLYPLPLYIAESGFSKKELEKITTAWKDVNSAFIEGVKSILNKLAKKWEVGDPKQKEDIYKTPTKRELRKILLSERQCKKVLVKGLNKDIRKIFDKDSLSGDCFMRALNGRNILYHEEASWDAKKLRGGKEHYWHFRRLWRYLYTEEQIFSIEPKP